MGVEGLEPPTLDYLSGECWCDWIRRRGDSNDGRVRDADSISRGDRYVIGRSVGQAANRARSGSCCRAALAPHGSRGGVSSDGASASVGWCSPRNSCLSIPWRGREVSGRLWRERNA